MEKVAIKATGIAKKYQIGKEYKGSLRESLASLFATKKSKKDFWALRDISFEINKGEIVGIMGKNGAGKSTLLKILSKITYPTKGKVELYGKVTSLLEVGTGFHPELTGRENIFLNGSILGMDKSEIKSVFDEIVDFSGVENFIDTPVKRYSSGMYVRLAFSVAAHLRSDILLIDEVLSVGDYEFQKRCLGRMSHLSESGRTVLFVSHNMGSILKFCNRSMLLEEGQIIKVGDTREIIAYYTGSFHAYERGFQPNEPVNHLFVKTNENGLIVGLEYTLDYQPKHPTISILLKNHQGVPVFGFNPQIAEVNNNKEVYEHQGKLELTISDVRLITGKYYIDLWFSDGVTDVFFEENVMAFDHINESFPRYQESMQIGSIIPKGKYSYSSL